MIYRIFPTEGLHLLRRDFARSVEDNAIRKTVMYIQTNIDQKLTTEQLARHAGMGQTTFFKKFKQATGNTPIDYILRERIRQAKILIQKDKLNLQSIAFQCGFNSYEYFCSSFKKIEKLKPTEYRRRKIRA